MSTLVARAETLAVDVWCSREALCVTLSDGRVVSVPLVWFPRLVAASSQERSAWELIGGGIGIHWEAIDEDISVASLLRAENFRRMPDKDLAYQSPSDSKYAAEPSRSQPSSCAGSLSCCPRLRGTTTNRQSSSGSAVISPHSFSNWATGKISS